MVADTAGLHGSRPPDGGRPGTPPRRPAVTATLKGNATMSLLDLAGRLLSRRPASSSPAPEGATHVLELVYQPADGSSRWELCALSDYQDNTFPLDTPFLDGPADLSEANIASFADEVLGYPVRLTLAGHYHCYHVSPR